jgi:hypothetical protein
MVASWNACLDHATGDLVHIMHADDRVAKDFYASTRAVLGANPNVGVVATGSASGVSGRSMHAPAHTLTASGTLRLLMSAQKPEAGAFVLRREAVGGARFSPKFPYCPDEEYFARLAAGSALAYLTAGLYVPRAHDGHARFATWMQPDFVDIYIDARLAAASLLGDPDSGYARKQSALRIVSVCAALLELHQRPMARRHIIRLTERLPLAGQMVRVRLMSALVGLPVGRKTMRVFRSLRRR